jgi:hypothetical protein
MAFVAGFTPEYSPIPQTTPKSEELLALNLFHVNILQRVLLACIRNLGGCPCPRCEIHLSKVHLVGTKRDRRNRIKLLRVDDEHRRFKVSQARKHIYDNNHAIGSAGVERMLQPLSLVPTTVRLLSTSLIGLTPALECLFRTLIEVRFQFFFNVHHRPYARGRVGFLESFAYTTSSYP